MAFRVKGFDWDEDNVDHIALHDVESHEVEEIFPGRTYVRRSRQGSYQILGRSAFGRYLFAVFALRPERIVRVITARDMSLKERRLYFREAT